VRENSPWSEQQAVTEKKSGSMTIKTTPADKLVVGVGAKCDGVVDYATRAFLRYRYVKNQTIKVIPKVKHSNSNCSHPS
jgi:hypothetical protein